MVKNQGELGCSLVSPVYGLFGYQASPSIHQTFPFFTLFVGTVEQHSGRSHNLPSDLGTAMPKLDTQRMTKKVLIIEDEEPLCQMYSAALCQADPRLEVVLSYNGEEGIEAALRERPHLVILDLALPAISGIEVAQKLREEGILPEVPLIIVSGMGQEAQVIAQSLGATAFLAKPFELGALVSAVEVSSLEAV